MPLINHLQVSKYHPVLALSQVFRHRDLRGLHLLALPDKDTMLIKSRHGDLRGLHLLALPDKDMMLITVYIQA